jgi:hypothetical protein
MWKLPLDGTRFAAMIAARVLNLMLAIPGVEAVAKEQMSNLLCASN